MKKILLFIIALFPIGTAIRAQDPQAYTLDLQNGNFLLKRDGKVFVTPEKEGSLFIIKADTLLVDTIIASKTNQTNKDFTMKCSSKEMMKTSVKKNIHVGEEGFSEPLLLVVGYYEIVWGSDKWEVKLQPIQEGTEEKNEEGLKEAGEDSDAAAEISEHPWKKAFFVLLGVVALLLVGICLGLKKHIARWLKKTCGKKSIFIGNEKGAVLNLDAYARQNKRRVKYVDDCLILRKNEEAMIIDVGDTTVKGNQLKITLKDPEQKINTIVYYHGENDSKPFSVGKTSGKDVFYTIDSEQVIRQIVIQPVVMEHGISITSLQVETQEKTKKEPKEEPKQPQPVEKSKEEFLMSTKFQESLMAIFSTNDEYKDLDENEKLEQLQQDIIAARNCKSEQQKGDGTPSTSDIEKDVEKKVKRKLRDNIFNSMGADSYLRTLAVYKKEEKDPDAFFEKLVEALKKTAQQKTTATAPVSSNIEEEKQNLLTKLKAIANTPDELRTEVYGFDTYVTRLTEFFAKLKEKDTPQKEPWDMVKELVEAINEKLPDGKKLNVDGDVEEQLKDRLALPTDFDEAERKVWNAVAEALGIDIVDADTLEDAINNKVQSKVEKQLKEKQAVKDAETVQLLAKTEHQVLEEVKSNLSGTIANVDKCKNVLEVVKKVKSAISGAQQRENNALAKIKEAYKEVLGQNLPEETGLKEAINRFKEDVPKSVSQQEWEKIGDAITSLGFAEVTNISEATLPSALDNYYQERLQKEMTSQLNHLKADPSNVAKVLNELNHSLYMTNEAEILCSKYDTNTITELKDKLEAETAAMKLQKEEVETQKAVVEKENIQRAEVISIMVDTLCQKLANGAAELGNLIDRAGYLKPIGSDDTDSEELAERNQEAMAEQYHSLQKALLATLPKDSKDLTPAEVRVKVQRVLEEDLAKSFNSKDFSQFSVIDKVARYYAYSRLPFMTENGQEADEAGSLRSYGVVFNRSKMTAIFTQMNQLLTDFGLQIIVPTLFAERLAEGHYQRSTSDGDLAILCPHPEYWKQTIANADKKDIIIDIAATGYYKDGELKKHTEVLINNN